MKRIINILEKSILYLWIFLTIIIVYLIIQRFVNPNYKGISFIDLKLYLKITIVVLVLDMIFRNLKKRYTNE